MLDPRARHPNELLHRFSSPLMALSLAYVRGRDCIAAASAGEELPERPANLLGSIAAERSTAGGISWTFMGVLGGALGFSGMELEVGERTSAAALLPSPI
mmetsp:Transcript_47882/g.85980  ORF Transcript_47882/g.85980 Transcript_47882/m.85980 type:complete len:100 (-) Transcript_47882:252-551(-)